MLLFHLKPVVTHQSRRLDSSSNFSSPGLLNRVAALILLVLCILRPSGAIGAEGTSVSLGKVKELLAETPQYMSAARSLGRDVFLQSLTLRGHDLNFDGFAELFVQLEHDSYQEELECARWNVYAAKFEESKVVLRRLADTGCQISIRVSKTNGYQDLFVSDAGTDEFTRFRLLKFHQVEYRLAERHILYHKQTVSKYTIIHTFDPDGGSTSNTVAGASTLIEDLIGALEKASSDRSKPSSSERRSPSQTMFNSPCGVQIAGDNNSVSLYCDPGISVEQIHAIVNACSLSLQIYSVHKKSKGGQTPANPLPALFSTDAGYRVYTGNGMYPPDVMLKYQDCLKTTLRQLISKVSLSA